MNNIDFDRIDNIIKSLREYAGRIIGKAESTHHEDCHTHHLGCLLIRASDQLSLLKKQIQSPNLDSDTYRLSAWGKGKDE